MATRGEVEDIAPRFARPVTFFDGSVTKANLTKHLDSVSVLHGATHGLLDDEDPLGSGLVLAGGDIWAARELTGIVRASSSRPAGWGLCRSQRGCG